MQGCRLPLETPGEISNRQRKVVAELPFGRIIVELRKRAPDGDESLLDEVIPIGFAKGVSQTHQRLGRIAAHHGFVNGSELVDALRIRIMRQVVKKALVRRGRPGLRMQRI